MTTTARELLQQAREPLLRLKNVGFASPSELATLAAIDAHLSEPDAQQAAAQPDAEAEPAPPNSLPSWDECALRVSNSEFIAKRVAEGGHGAEPDSKLATELHRFIYEYDDADPYRSTWFLHRLEKLLEETRATPPAGERSTNLIPSTPEEERRWLEGAAADMRRGPSAGERSTPAEPSAYPALLAAAVKVKQTHEAWENAGSGKHRDRMGAHVTAVRELCALLATPPSAQPGAGQ